MFKRREISNDSDGDAVAVNDRGVDDNDGMLGDGGDVGGCGFRCAVEDYLFGLKGE